MWQLDRLNHYLILIIYFDLQNEESTTCCYKQEEARELTNFIVMIILFVGKRSSTQLALVPCYCCVNYSTVHVHAASLSSVNVVGYSEQQWSCWNTNTETLHEITKTGSRELLDTCSMIHGQETVRYWGNPMTYYTCQIRSCPTRRPIDHPKTYCFRNLENAVGRQVMCVWLFGNRFGALTNVFVVKIPK